MLKVSFKEDSSIFILYAPSDTKHLMIFLSRAIIVPSDCGYILKYYLASLSNTLLHLDIFIRKILRARTMRSPVEKS
jgi:hypothetical protein